jgi:hypothetical protein
MTRWFFYPISVTLLCACSGGGGGGRYNPFGDAGGSAASCFPACLSSPEFVACRGSGSCTAQLVSAQQVNYCFGNGVKWSGLQLNAMSMPAMFAVTKNGAPCYSGSESTAGPTTTIDYQFPSGKKWHIVLDSTTNIYRIDCEGMTYQVDLNDPVCQAEAQSLSMISASLLANCTKGTCN